MGERVFRKYCHGEMSIFTQNRKYCHRFVFGIGIVLIRIVSANESADSGGTSARTKRKTKNNNN